MVHMEYFPLHTVIYEAAKSFAPLAAEKNINLKTRINTNSYFYGDPGRIKQLTAILLDNALKYTPPGGEVILQLTGRNSVIELSVTDTGEGIAKEHQDKIFERFYRIDKVRSRQDGGTGLGLAIAARIVKEHQGTIKVISSPDAGTTFVLPLPQASSGVSAKHR